MIPAPLAALLTALAFSSAGCVARAARPPPGPQPGAREDEAPSAEEVAAELANPLAPITTLSLQLRHESGLGPDDDSNRQLRLQPSFFRPFSGSSALLVRTILPVRFSEFPADESGLGDLSILPYYVPDTSARNFIGYGAAFGFDTASEDTLGSGRTTAGPALLFAATGQPWTWGGLGQHLWSIDSSSRADVRVTTLQPFATRLLGQGWAATLTSETSYNWEAPSDEAWTIPLAAGTSKVVTFGREYVNVALSGVVYFDNPEFVPDWELRLGLTYVLR